MIVSCFIWACGTGYQPADPQPVTTQPDPEPQEDEEPSRLSHMLLPESIEPPPAQTLPTEPGIGGEAERKARTEMLEEITAGVGGVARKGAASADATGSLDAGALIGGVGAGGGGRAMARSRLAQRAMAVVPRPGVASAPPWASMAVPDDPVPEPFNREGYNAIYENQFVEAVQHPLSTFSIDVDAASYSNIRRFISSNQLPPKDAVRIEEMVNYFTYDYPEPGRKHPFSVTTEVSSAPWNPAHRLAHIGIQGRHIPTRHLPPSNLVFLLDVSGSMNSPDKLPLLKSAFRLLVEQLRPEDRVAIVVYAGAAGLVLPSTPGSRKDDIFRVLDRLAAGGSTAGGAGINLAYEIARQNFKKSGNNRVVLATDGDFNVGVSSDGALVRLIEEKRKSGIFLTVLGFGTGNLQDAKMEQLADKGNGNYAYIDNIREARKVLVNEMGGTLVTIAKDVKIQIEFNPVHVKAYRLIGYENRMLQKEDFNNDKKDAGELGAGHTVTALYEIIPPGVDTPMSNVDPLKYQTTQIRSDAYVNPELLTVKLRYKRPDGDTSRLIERPVSDDDLSLEQTSNNFRFSASVAEFGLLLRDSEFKGAASYDRVVRLARASQGEDREGYRGEFIRMVETCALLAPTVSMDDDAPYSYR